MGVIYITEIEGYMSAAVYMEREKKKENKNQTNKKTRQGKLYETSCALGLVGKDNRANMWQLLTEAHR